jgi:vancomycin resistance protein VanJ
VSRRRPLLRGVAWPYALLAVAVLALWHSPWDLPAVQVVDLATFWWALPAVALTGLALLRRDGRAALLLAVPAALWLWAYGSAFLPTSTPDASPDLRVVAYNTDVAAPDGDHVAMVAETTSADVLLLQEVFPPREEELADRLGASHPHVHVDQSEGVGGVGVWSRHPIVEVVAVTDVSDRSRRSSIVVIDVGGRRVQVAPFHLVSPCPTCGPSVLERLELEGTLRRAEVGAVLDALDPDLPAIVGGDLNSNERGTAYRRFVAAGFDDPQRSVGWGMGFTWPNGRLLPPLLRIDTILSRGLMPVASEVPDVGGSDHRPVVVDLAWQEG